MDNYATYDALMKHMKDNQKIEINETTDKYTLMRIGYYHGVKGYRFYRDSTNFIQYDSFTEVCSVIEFDEELKATLYSPIMQLEAAIKSYSCDRIVNYVCSSNFSDLFDKGFDNTLSARSKKYRTRDNVYASLTKRYEVSPIIKHYYNQDKPVPMWAIFEELMLGDLSRVIDALNPDLKLSISEALGITKRFNTKGALLPQVLYAIKDLRNAIAHNKVIFDGRYIEFKKRNSLKTMLENETHIPNINFDCLIDDVILICFLMYNFSFPKPQIIEMYNRIEKSVSKLKVKLPNRLFQQISGRTIQKLPSLKNYVFNFEEKS